MTQASEIRLDNLFYWGVHVVPIKSIHTESVLKNSVNVYIRINENLPHHCVNIDDIRPIPLTPEILEKAGFEKREQGVCDYFHIGINNITHDFLFDLVWLKNSITNNVEGMPFYKNGRHEMKYLHQLQNLYFALTGEELKIEL